eukprot:scaffold5742_cov95-Isochrysis_galbana.AAC.1
MRADRCKYANIHAYTDSDRPPAPGHISPPVLSIHVPAICTRLLQPALTPPSLATPKCIRTPTYGRHPMAVHNSTGQPHPPFPTHQPIQVRKYPYLTADGSLDLEGWLSTISDAPAGSVFVVHACAHNPSGVDPSAEQVLTIEPRQLEAI